MGRLPTVISSLATLLLCLSISSAGLAQAIDQRDLPAELREWVPWVLDQNDEFNCATAEGDAVCCWPSKLHLVLTDQGGRFEYTVVTDIAQSVALPGDNAHWPQQVTVDRKPAVVLIHDERPHVRVEPGTHQLSGQFSWPRLPEGIRVPAEAALVTLNVQGRPILFPSGDEEGRLWLKRLDPVAAETKLDIEVMRKISDAVPLTITTRLVVRASGQATEAHLPHALLADTVPMSVTADLPARLDANGQLSLQLRPGTHTITIVARTNGSPTLLTLPPRSDPWPMEEVWVFEAADKLRQVELLGPPGIDPSQTNLPAEWKGYPAFSVTAKTPLAIKTIRRGEPDPPPNDLSLSRSLWLDLDGSGFTGRDELSGSLSRSWRLDLHRPIALGHATVNGQDVLITADKSGKHAGVELRSGQLKMTADWRLESHKGLFPAVGWSEDIQRLSTRLHLPPGWELITAKGVDELQGTWWHRWDLFGFFFVLVIALAVGKLTRWYVGLITLFALVLSFHEPDAPLAVWAGLSITLGLLKVLPAGKLHVAGKLLFAGCFIWLLLVLVPFCVTQIRVGLFPQVGDSTAGRVFFADAKYDRQVEMANNEKREAELQALEGHQEDVELDKVLGEMTASGAAADTPQLARSTAQSQRSVDMPLEDKTLFGSSGATLRQKAKYKKRRWAKRAMQQDPQAIVQTGPGVPGWSWRQWTLNWSGPVSRDHRIQLYLMPPSVHLGLSIARVLMLILISLFIVWEAKRTLAQPPPKGLLKKSGPGKTAAAGAVLLAALMGNTAPAQAEVPASRVLDELKTRLTRRMPCQPECVSVSVLDIDIDPRQLQLTAEVHVGDLASVRLPGPAKNWVPQEVRIEGRATQAMVRGEDGFIRVRLEPGRHQLIARGPLPKSSSLMLELGDEPFRVNVSADGWTVDGVREDGRAEQSIQFTRRTTRPAGATAEPEFEKAAYPPWLEITRTLDLGIPWLVHTRVRRISPPGTPVLARVPLIPGEAVTESEVQVEAGQVVLSLGRHDTELGWSSTLKEQDQLQLSAAEGKPWSEIWILKCSPIWQCDFSGLIPTERQPDKSFEPVFRPWPGETLDLKMSRPSGIQGQTKTVDSAVLNLRPGIRLLKATLSLTIRSSHGGVQGVTLPEGATLQTVLVNNSPQPYSREGSTVTIPLKTGGQRVELVWQQEGGITAAYRTPKVVLDGGATNAKIEVSIPSDRWLLAARGPDWGPAILFWGTLVAVLLAGLLLGRIKLSPLKSWQWMLLALGLTQIPVPVALIIVGWFFALAYRAKVPFTNFVVHNMGQILLGLWTVAAVACLIGAVYNGLAVQPDMQVEGAGSSNTQLNWYVHGVTADLPMPLILSVPLLVWKLIMLAWALWLAASIVKWAPWAWRSFSTQILWRPIPPPKPRPKKSPPSPKAPTVEEPPSPAEDPSS